MWIVTADDVSASEDAEVVSWILYGPDSPLVTTSDLFMFENEPDFGTSDNEGLTAEFDLNIGPNETQYLMFFVGVEGVPADGVDLAAAFEDTDSAFFRSRIDDLSPAQLAATVNWVPEPATGVLALADEPHPVPTMPEWGIAVTTLLLLAIVSVLWARREPIMTPSTRD